MLVSVTDTHDSHGVVFTLNLAVENGNEEDSEVLRFLGEFIGSLVEGEFKDRSTLCSYRIQLSPEKVSLCLAESTKRLARVNGRWNHSREDQKFVVAIIEDDPQNEMVGPAKHYVCHWCQKEVWGVHRDTMVIYDKQFETMRLVSVHDDCKEIREKQIAEIPFEKVE